MDRPITTLFMHQEVQTLFPANIRMSNHPDVLLYCDIKLDAASVGQQDLDAAGNIFYYISDVQQTDV